VRPGAGLPLLLLAAAAPAALADESPPGAGAPPPAAHPGIETGGERLYDLRGAVEAGVRFTAGDTGRFEQDVNLESGPRLLRLDLEGTAARRGVALGGFAIHARGLGDPDRRVEVSARRNDAWEALAYSDRQEYVYRASWDPHPFDTAREREGGSLRLHPARGLAITLEGDRLSRRGDSRLDQVFVREHVLPVEAPVRYDRRRGSVAVDGTSGDFRFGVRHSVHGAKDDALRTLFRADTPVDDAGNYDTDSRIRGTSTTARAGVRLLGGALDLSCLAGTAGTATDSRFGGRHLIADAGIDGMPGTPDDRAFSQEARGTSAARLREDTLRLEADVAPRESLDLLARVERVSARERSRLDGGTRTQTPPFADPALRFSKVADRLEGRGVLDRDSLEALWRPARTWRLRAGVERVAELVDVDGVETSTSPIGVVLTRPIGDDRPRSSPKTVVGTAGVDFTPSDRFDASLLVRRARAGGTTLALATDEGDSFSLRLRARRPDGWHASAHARVKERSRDDPDSRVSYDSLGATFGREEEAGSFLLSATRESFVVASDTAFVLNRTLEPDPHAHRVRYDETVDVLSADFDRRVSGPLRVFGAARWVHAEGDLPSVARDASLGLGWRLALQSELRLEARSVSYRESRRNLDDYGARVVTLSFVQEF